MKWNESEEYGLGSGEWETMRNVKQIIANFDQLSRLWNYGTRILIRRETNKWNKPQSYQEYY